MFAQIKPLRLVSFVAMGLLSLPWIISTAALAQDTPLLSGKYIIFIMGKQFGIEEFKLVRGEGDTILWEGCTVLKGNIGGNDVDATLQTRVTTTRDYIPTRYTLDALVKGQKQSMEVVFKGNVANCKIAVGKQLTRKVELHDGAVILDGSIFHHVLFFTQKYDYAKTGPQNVFIFTPQALAEFSGSVERKPDSVLQWRGQTVPVKKLVVNLGMLTVELYVDNQGNVLKILNPLQGAKAILEGVEETPVPKKVVPEPQGIKESAVEFHNGDVKLAGTLTVPENFSRKLPAVILVSGSGPQDRNENVRLNRIRDKSNVVLAWEGPDWNIFRDIAWKIGKSGIAVLRYDDRGVGKSEGDFEKAKLSDFVYDVCAGVNFLRSRDDIDPARICVIGHSEGGIIAPIVASRDPGIKAIVLMAGTSRPLDVIIQEQIEDRLKQSKVPEEQIRQTLEVQKKFFAEVAKCPGDELEIYNQKMFIGWWKEHILHQPVAEIQKVTCHVLVLQGMRDMQVLPYNAKELEEALQKSGKASYSVRRFEKLDHLFMLSTGNLSDYADPDRRLSPEFLDCLVEWLQQNL